MDLAADLPVTLVVKAANQRVADQTVECVLGWTIRKLKQHLESVYPSKPKHHQQKLIYSGQLLADHLTLKEVLRQYDDQNSRHTVHLVCSPSVESLSQAGPSQSHSSETKSEPSTNAQTPISSSSAGESDGLRHRGAHVQSPASSNTGVTNAGISPTVPVPGGPGVGGMPDMGAMAGMGGMPMMGGVPGIAGYHYTPEQMAWMQQMYSQYMAQYMQYYGYQAQRAPQQPNPVQAQVPQQAANAAPANNAPANQNMRMNAQGGLEVDDEEEQRDWLDYIYVFFRFMILMSIVYFYSSAYRFLAVSLVFIAIYLLRNGWWMLNRRAQQQQQQQQQQQVQQPPPPPQQQQQQPQEQEQPHNQADSQNNDRQNGTEDLRGEEGETQEVPPAPEVPSTAAVVVRLLITFFTSLVPTQPPAVNGN